MSEGEKSNLVFNRFNERKINPKDIYILYKFACMCVNEFVCMTLNIKDRFKKKSIILWEGFF